MKKNIIVLCVISIFLLTSTTVVSVAEQYTTASTVDWWPMYHHDSQHTGYSTSTAPNTNNVIWSITEDNGGFGSPVVVEDRIFVNSMSYSGDNYKGNVYCIDARDGVIKWIRSLGDAVWGTPAIADGKLYIGSSLKSVFCLDVRDGNTIWEFKTEGDKGSSAVVSNGRVYIGSNDHNLYCLDATANGELIWKKTIDGYLALFPPVVSNGNVYVTSAETLVCMDADNGDVLWTYEVDTYIYCCPAIYKNKIYFISTTSQFDRNGDIHCLDCITGDEIWKTQGHFFTRNSPALAYDRVYILSWADLIGHFLCLDAGDGRILWDKTISRECALASPSIADGKVFFSESGVAKTSLYAFDAFTGNKIWSYDKLSICNIFSDAAIADGKVFTGTHGSLVPESCMETFYCFGDKSNQPNPPTITGEDNGQIETEYTYDVVSTDPEGDDIYYYVDWGDNCQSRTEFVSSGETSELTHKWEYDGAYIIRAKAIDETGAESDWSILKVIMPKNKPYINRAFLNFLQNHPLIYQLLQQFLQRTPAFQ